MAQNIMQIDLSKCVGCGTCGIACKIGNNTPKRQRGQTYNRADFITETAGVFPATTWQALPVGCNHCDRPKCVGVCPVKVEITGDSVKIAALDAKSKITKGGKTYRRAMYKLHTDLGGEVLHDDANCIGCGRCQNACPYSTQDVDRSKAQFSVISKNLLGSKGMPFYYMNSTTEVVDGCTATESEVREAVGDTDDTAPAPAYVNRWAQYVDAAGGTMNDVRPAKVAEKCYLCKHRTSIGKNPYCVDACPSGARSIVTSWPTGGKVLAPKTQTKLSKIKLITKPINGLSSPNVAYIGEYSKR